MMSKTYWCLNKNCSRKRVVYYPMSSFEKGYEENRFKTFLCLECNSRFTKEEVGCRATNTCYKSMEGNKELCKMLRDRCKEIEKEKSEVVDYGV